jgi:hypothetical protein
MPVLAALLAAAMASVLDLELDERSTIVVYTTPALRDVLEKEVVPRFERETGYRVALVYVPAGQQYNRLRLSGDRPEADLLLHASPLYLEKGYESGHVDPLDAPWDERVPDGHKSRLVEGGRVWYAFAWSPLVEVYGPGVERAPDLATSDATFGFPHPLLSNNGIYAALFFEEASPEAGARALARTRVQPVNARANIGGVADGSFALTIGYEAVVRFFQEQGARVAYELPLLDGRRVTTPVIFSASLVRGKRHPATEDLLRCLFAEEVQSRLAGFHFRAVVDGDRWGAGLLDLDAIPHRTIDYDWSLWPRLEGTLPSYEVRT